MAETTFALTRARTQPETPKRSVHLSPKRASTAKQQNRSAFGARKLHYIVKDINQFGATSPSWTISGSRKDAKPPPDYPPPGHYDVPIEHANKTIPHTIQEREPIDYRTITSNIDYIYNPVFPRKEPITHNYVQTKPEGESKPSFIPPSDSPGPRYYPGEKPARYTYYKQHFIGKHEAPKEQLPEITPSSHDYYPVKVSLPRSPAYSFQRIVVSDDQQRRNVDTGSPGPGAYNVGPQVRRAPKWTDRLRVYTPKSRPVTSEADNRPWDAFRIDYD